MTVCEVPGRKKNQKQEKKGRKGGRREKGRKERGRRGGRERGGREERRKIIHPGSSLEGKGKAVFPLSLQTFLLEPQDNGKRCLTATLMIPLILINARLEPILWNVFP